MSALGELDNLRVVLVSTRNPLNIGAAARAMSNFGFGHLRVVTPYERAYREARSAVGAAPVLAKAEEFDSVAEAVGDCRLVVGTTAVGHRELHHPLRRLEDGAKIIRKMLARGAAGAAGNLAQESCAWESGVESRGAAFWVREIWVDQ